MKVGTKLFVCQNCNVGTMVKPNELDVVVCCENCGIERLIYEPVYSSKRFKWVLSKGNTPKTIIDPPSVAQALDPLDGLARASGNGGCSLWKLVPVIVAFTSLVGCASMVGRPVASESLPVSISTATTYDVPLSAYLKLANSANLLNPTPSQPLIGAATDGLLLLVAAGAGWYAKHKTLRVPVAPPVNPPLPARP